jgi:hypothetical protein
LTTRCRCFDAGKAEKGTHTKNPPDPAGFSYSYIQKFGCSVGIASAGCVLPKARLILSANAFMPVSCCVEVAPASPDNLPQENRFWLCNR